MKPQHEIKKMIKKHYDKYQFAEKYIKTYGLKVEDIFEAKDSLRITCKNYVREPVYLKVESEQLFMRVGSILKDWKIIYNQTF